jgi:hypothetical protein
MGVDLIRPVLGQAIDQLRELGNVAAWAVTGGM